MELFWACLAAAGASIWVAVLVLPWRVWDTRVCLDSGLPGPQEDLSDVTAVIPARNEAAFIRETLSALRGQGLGLTIIVVDDQSSDGTADIAKRLGKERLQVIAGEAPPAGWSGKIWALHQGFQKVKSPLTLLLDADIELRPGIVSLARSTMKKQDLQFLSLMAALRMVTFWERLLLPAFIYFFKLLYPFRLSNTPSSRVAAAAGGFILLETGLLHEIGGFETIRGELIDDCALARSVKSSGYRTWIGLTHSVRSLRPYSRLRSLWNMVARSAFTQLRYSALFLILCTAALMAAFWAPVAGAAFGSLPSRALSAVALGAMILSYLPTLDFYSRSKWWVLTLPLAGALYLGMTWTSAVRYWMGKGSHWKERTYRT
jgi:hopene-associated glycosyltransferase HpnB